MTIPGTLLLARRDVAALLDVEACVTAVERAFALHGGGKCPPPGVLGLHVAGGGFHVKAGVLDLGRRYFAAKVNANFPENGARHGLPTIQGVVVLCDADNGSPLALLDSMEITRRRTAAASAVAAKYLARADACVVTICGCGDQAAPHLRAIAHVRRLTQAYAFDRDAARARGFAAALSAELGIPVLAIRDLGAATRQSDIVVTCTTSTRAILGPNDVRPGVFVAAVGADNPEKQEVEPALLARGTVVVDVLEQAIAMGDLHHAIKQGVIARGHVHAELGEIVAGKKPGRRFAEEIIVFDSTGMALQDVAAAAVVYERALTLGRGIAVDLGAGDIPA